jgi:manganese-dependent inorganic pyrophosphatase
MIKVFGHQSPDTDATGSAIVWAWYLSAHTSREATPFVLGPLNSETQFVLNRWNVPAPAVLEKVEAGDSVVIVDTNNPQELFLNINETSIESIIDHHKLVGGLETSGPIEITMRPLASTASVIHDLLGAHKETIPNDIAGIMLSCILSDTLEFRSPTTTPHDKDIAEQLAKKLAIDIRTYAQEMFAAKSDISSFTDSGLVKLDSKKYAVGAKNLRISVVETTNPETVLARKQGILEAMGAIIDEESDIDDILFFIVDILKEEATVLTYSALTKEIIEKSFDVSVQSDTEILPGIVSRKKQILPVLTI